MKVNYSVVGLTISSWGGNIAGKYYNITLFINIIHYNILLWNIDVLNGVSAAKIKKSELAINSIIGS
jgi:hypothetical protein